MNEEKKQDLSEYLADIIRNKKTGRVTLVIGRQAGKTTLFDHMQATHGMNIVQPEEFVNIKVNPTVIGPGEHLFETQRALIKIDGVVIGEMKPIEYIPNNANPTFEGLKRSMEGFLTIKKADNRRVVDWYIRLIKNENFVKRLKRVKCRKRISI